MRDINMLKDELIIDETDKILICKTQAEELDWVVSTERDKDNADFVYQWSYAEHLAALSNPDICHFVVKDKESNKNLGYVILDEVNNSSNSIYFRFFI